MTSRLLRKQHAHIKQKRSDHYLKYFQKVLDCVICNFRNGCLATFLLVLVNRPVQGGKRMTQPFLGQIQPMGFNFAPRNWAQCNGQIMSISQNTALFALLGTTYGGNGSSTFGLPNLQSRVPMHFGTLNGEPFSLGEMAGTETVTLNINEMPSHNHAFMGSNGSGNAGPPSAGAALATVAGSGGGSFYGPVAALQPLAPTSIGNTGGNQPHTNIQPYLTINWCIATSGIFPARN